MVDPIVIARGWGMRHATRREWAVRDLDLVVERGEVVLLCGTSGSGKSMLLHALAGVDRDGEIEGTLLNSASVTAYVQQDPDSQIIMARVDDDVAFGPESLGLPVEEIHQRTAGALEAMQVAQPWDRDISRLSGGERQRVALAGAWAMQPELLLLDEPTSMLDEEGIQAVRELITLARQADMTVIIVEHRVDAIVDLVDRVHVLDAGIAGTPEHVFTEHRDRLIALGLWVPGYSPDFQTTQNTGSIAATVVTDRTLWQIHENAIAAITGPNGCGKSRALMTMAGLVDQDRSTVSSAVSDSLPSDPARWRSADYPGRISMVFQNPEHQFMHRTVRAELNDDLLMERLQLHHVAEAEPHTLSGGEQRRLSVGIALSAQPKVLLLDEPTFGLDLSAWKIVVREVIHACAGGAAVGLASHDEHLLALTNTLTPMTVGA